jgi:hypothetical protein
VNDALTPYPHTAGFTRYNRPLRGRPENIPLPKLRKTCHPCGRRAASSEKGRTQNPGLRPCRTQAGQLRQARPAMPGGPIVYFMLHKFAFFPFPYIYLYLLNNLQGVFFRYRKC